MNEESWLKVIIGFFFFLILVLLYCIMALAGDQMVYEVLSIFSQIFLHLFTFGVDILLWIKTDIDYICLLELDSTNKLKYMEVFLACLIYMLQVVIFMLAYVFLIIHWHSSTLVKAMPGVLILMFLFVVMLRYHYLEVIRNILSFFWKVTMLHAFVADQLCSQAPTLRNLGYVVSYYLKLDDYRYLAIPLSLIPFLLRAIQCLIWSFKERKMSHFYNFGKYSILMVEVGLTTAYAKEKVNLEMIVGISFIATLYLLYWDIFHDWGLLQPKSRNPWLRDELILRNKNIYFWFMVLDIALRFAWLPAMRLYYLSYLDYEVMSSVLAVLEVLRRGLWNFYRLEYEHAKNASDEMDQV